MDLRKIFQLKLIKIYVHKYKANLHNTSDALRKLISLTYCTYMYIRAHRNKVRRVVLKYFCKKEKFFFVRTSPLFIFFHISSAFTVGS